MSKVFIFMISLLVMYVFLGLVFHELGQQSNQINQNIQFNTTDIPTESETQTGIFAILWDAATFQIEGIDPIIQVFIFGPLNLAFLVALLFLIRGVG